MTRDLTGLAIKASFWSGAEGVTRALVGFGVTIALARMISPSEFGVVAMILLFSAIAEVLTDFGVGTALIQRRDAGPPEESTAFYFNVGMSVLMAVALGLSGPWIARFFEQPALTGIAWIMAANLVIGALGAIHTTLLTKALDFRPQMIIGIWSSLLSGVLAIVLAWQGYGVWALAWQVLAQTTIGSLLLWLQHPWRPMRTFDWRALDRLLAFGGHWMIARLIDSAYTRLYSVFIGKLFGASDLGFYTRAYSTQQLPASLLTRVLNRVALPAFSEAAHDPLRLRAAVAKSSRLLMFVNVPAMLGLSLTAEPLVRVLFGVRWLPAVPLVQILALAGMLWPLQVLNISALAAQGHSKLLLRMELIKKAIGVSALAIACPWGLEAIAWSQVATAGIAFFINSHYSGKVLEFGGMAQLRAVSRIAWAAIAMAAVVLVLDSLIDLRPFHRLLTLIVAGFSTYMLASFLLGELSPLKVRETLRAWFPRLSGSR